MNRFVSIQLCHSTHRIPTGWLIRFPELFPGYHFCSGENRQAKSLTYGFLFSNPK